MSGDGETGVLRSPGSSRDVGCRGSRSPRTDGRAGCLRLGFGPRSTSSPRTDGELLPPSATEWNGAASSARIRCSRSPGEALRAALGIGRRMSLRNRSHGALRARSGGDLMMKWWDARPGASSILDGLSSRTRHIPPSLQRASHRTAGRMQLGPDRMDVFARGARGEILHKWWNVVMERFLFAGDAGDGRRRTPVLPRPGRWPRVPGARAASTSSRGGRRTPPPCWWDGTGHQ